MYLTNKTMKTILTILTTATLTLLFLMVSCGKDPNNTETPSDVERVVINGVSWATHNLAAHGKFVNNPQDYGALFQWGRRGDGHEQGKSASCWWSNDLKVPENFDANGQIVSSHPAFGEFIRGNSDWRGSPRNTLWNSGTESSPIKTPNDPCPPGWRMPTETELNALVSVGSTWTDDWNETGAAGRVFGTAPNTLFLPAAGYRNYSDGSLNFVGTGGNYWSSTVGGTFAWYLHFSSGNVYMSNYNRALGFSVRCVSE
ncbi:MAG: fibrobacter succinogenes major paralogous domain-containing protein [Bacteroidales bacterium]|nr:fibrobacter succinogenes major paralogous domain-containing protein [Bacteroidales bacterium]